MGAPYREIRLCPRCGASLTDRPLSNTRLQICDTCGGVWLDHRSTRRMIEAHEADAVLVLAELTRRPEISADTSIAAIPCPDCGQRLAVKRFFPGNVTVDLCPDHGIWFDANELQRMSRAAEHHRRSKALRKRSRELDDATGAPSPDGSTTEDSPAARAAALANGIGWLFRSASAALNRPVSSEDEGEGPDRQEWTPTARRPNR